MTASTGSCKECSTGVEFCAFCEREDCPQMMCYRCLRAALGLLIPEPHVHGG